MRSWLRPRWYRALERFPRWYSAYVRWRRPDWPVVTARHDLVVAGYPACANTFAREAVLHVNPGLQVASHVHSYTQVAVSTRLRLPTILLVREPLAAVSSVLVRFDDRRPEEELSVYARLYERSLPFLDRVVVADFQDVTARYGDVLRAVNQRFGTSFVPFPHGEDAGGRAVLQKIDAYDSSQFGVETETRTARPTQEKEARKQAVRRELLSAELRPAVERCERVYERLREAAVPLPGAGG